MTSLYDLWNEEKYSEGDPIRQLIGATKGVKDWPMDAVAWGADTVDLITAGLAHIAKQNPGLAKAIKTDLGGNLRRSTKEGYDRPTMTQGPSPDVEAGRSVGRMLNPFLWAGGQKIPTPKMDLMNFNPARRAFLSARDAAYSQPTEDLGNAASALLNVPMDRRTFNKGAVAAGGAAATGLGGLKLLERFAPEAKQVAEAVPKVAEQVTKHRYNSLQEYLDDVSRSSKELTDDFVSDWQHAGFSKGLPEERVPWTYSDEFSQGIDDFYSRSFKKRLLKDENYYNKIKELGPEEAAYREYFDDATEFFDMDELQVINSYWSPKKLEDLPRETQKTIRDMSEHAKQRLDWFSPQARKEMKEYKDFVKQYRGEENWSRPDDMMDWINGDRIPF